jgi:hypothetical protein
MYWTGFRREIECKRTLPMPFFRKMSHHQRILGMSLMALALVWLVPQETSSAQFTASIEGVLKDRESGSPVGGVKVHYTSLATAGKNAPFVTTDPQGRFVIEVRSPGLYYLFPNRSGYIYSRPEGVKTPFVVHTVRIAEAASTVRVELPIVKEGVVVGQILDRASGQPVPSVIVTPLVRTYGQQGEIFAGTNTFAEGLGITSIPTNDRGEYRIFGLPEGDYYLAYRRYTPGEGVVGPLFGYYPGVDDLANAVQLHVAPGETRAETIRTETPNRAVEVRLRYDSTALNLLPGPSPLVTFLAGGRSQSNVDRVTEQQGGVSFRIMPGHYTLTLQVSSQNRNVLYSHMSLDVGTQNVEKEITLTRAVNITGKVTLRDATGNQIANNVRCWLSGVPQAIEFSLLSAGSIECLRAQVSSGKYQLRLTLMPADAYVNSARSGGRDLLQDGIEISKDEHFEIEAATPGAVVRGIVADDRGAAVSGATVALVPNAPYRNAIVLYRSALSLHDGTYELRGVAPGSYLAFAWTDRPGWPYHNAEFLKDYEPKGTPLKIENSEPVSVNLIALE